MPIDYLTDFPLPQHLVPPKLRALLTPTGLDPQEPVDVTRTFQEERQDIGLECVHMLMAVVPEEEADKLAAFDDWNEGVVAHSVPVLGEKGKTRKFEPSISGHDYVVASWGSGSFYNFSLAEKVWMALGLTARCVGSDHQRLVYDDLSLPAAGVAEGEVSSQYHFEPSRNVNWRMSNEYLRKYLWMRGAVGVRNFYYQASLPDRPELRALMNGDAHYVSAPGGGWYDFDLREHQGRLQLQLWATVVAVSCELSPNPSADGLAWPGIDGPMNHERANAMLHDGLVYLEDRFLERYEQNRLYDSMPGRGGSCNPSYQGQWTFTDCVRVGRNLVQVPIRELYKPKPDREVLHAHRFVVPMWQVNAIDRQEEHIAAKTQRLVAQLLDLGDNLSELGDALGEATAAADVVKFSRAEIEANWWRNYEPLGRLAQVAPLDMPEQAFLTRCKTLHEVWQGIRVSYLRRLLRHAGCPGAQLDKLAGMKLLQSLVNVLEQLDAQQQGVAAFASAQEPDGWGKSNPKLAPLFLNNDIRIVDAHELGEALQPLQNMGFDTAEVNQGHYGKALDFVFDAVISSFEAINQSIRRALER